MSRVPFRQKIALERPEVVINKLMHSSYFKMIFFFVFHLSVRLVSGYDRSVTSQRGIVEVLFGAVWGTICRDSWDLNDSHVICRHLGYDEAESDFDPQAFGDFVVETELTWISNVRCKGNESFLSECSFDEWGRTLCRSFTPASVICKPPGI